MRSRITFYHPSEERLNVLTHGFGLILSVFALVLLVVYSSLEGTLLHIVSFSVYGISLVILYLASTLYHLSRRPRLRFRLCVFDHAAIFLLIAGSYTPFTLHVIEGNLGLVIFGAVWTLALFGIAFKLFHTGRYNAISTVAYVLMGWIAIFAIEPFISSFDRAGVVWVFAGGFAYTFGAIMYGLKRIKFNHAIFHAFVLFGSICHFIAVFFYVLPRRV